jgi:hypothetical protein
MLARMTALSAVIGQTVLDIVVADITTHWMSMQS